MKTFPPETMGLLFPAAGSLTRQRMFLSLLHSSGRLASADLPSRFGPRKNGQSAACIGRVSVKMKSENKAAATRIRTSEEDRLTGLGAHLNLIATSVAKGS